jgi:L-aspartate oxidase
MGGVLVDAQGRSNVDGLWVCGEAASTGAHGANRLASNSLLEAVVFAASIADDLSGIRPRLRAPVVQPWSSAVAPAGRADTRAIGSLRRLMTDKVGVVRDAAGLAAALSGIAELERRPGAAHIANPLIAAKLIAAAAFARTETRGAHARSDFPTADVAQAHRSYITLDAANRLADQVADRAPARKRLATVA